MDDPNILDIDFQILGHIEMILENKSTRESFLKVIPPEYFSNTTIQLMDNEAYKYHMTTARWLLFQFGNKDVRVSRFAQWLEEANLEKALVLLKKDVPLKIIEQPPQFLCIKKGSKLAVSCKASSYPPPEYQWFKGDQELLLQQESQLVINCLKEEDSGIYVCLVSKHNLETGDFSYIYSNAFQLDVIEESIGPTFFSELGQYPLALKKSIVSNLDYCPSTSETCQISERICIIKQPYISGKVSQGMSVCLHCKAASEHPVEYQWYRNGRILHGSNSPKLHLNDLYPDPQTGDMKWEYFCEVSNACDKQFSQTVVVELENSNDTTPYYASEKYAFMVANDQYDNLEELKKPAFDVADLGDLLMSMKFNVFAYRNLTLCEMINAFNRFYEHLIPNSYVLFYFAGHGFEHGQMYLIPVDCSSNYNPQECMCTEYILQRMQETNPALNILLIDACRNLPPPLRTGVDLVAPLGKIFEAKMKNNTVYGYSTESDSYESDSECNSFFVKYLKKYITYNKNIEDILRLVRIDFEGDPMIKGVQFPVVKTSLCGNRKLCDEIISNDLINERLMELDDIKSKFVTWEFEFPRVKSVFMLNVTPFLNIFMNEIEITVYLHIEEQTSKQELKILKDLEVDLIFETPGIQVKPTTGVALKTIDLKINNQNKVLKKQIIGLQKMKIKELTGKLMLKFFHLKVQRERDFFINVEKIIFTNYLG